jgi:hypothetical protein
MNLAAHHCRVCAAPHMTLVVRGSFNGRDAYMVIETREVFCAETGLKITTMRCTSEFKASSVLRILITSGGLCQRHHLRLDAKHRAKNAARTRRAKGGQLDLEDML